MWRPPIGSAIPRQAFQARLDKTPQSGHFVPRPKAWCDKTLHEQPDFPPALRFKAATSCLRGRLDEGRAGVERLLAVIPDTTVFSMRLYYGVFMKKPECIEAFLDGLRKAGLPE